MLKMIDHIWKSEGLIHGDDCSYILDMNLTPYGVLSAPFYKNGELREFGFIEKINGRTLRHGLIPSFDYFDYNRSLAMG